MTGISSAPHTSTAGAAGAAGYDAFISYSRKDIVFARALEKALKSYRPPRDLGLPDRHLRVFRDEADFTGVEYTDAIRRHLAAAGKLIVLASPAARASRYADEEIRLFAELRGADSIIPVLLSGIPNNEAGAGNAADLAFPESLCRVMPVPLAADYRGFDPAKPRPNRGAHESAWFKLLADIYGVPRSVIAQREKRRQAATRRRWIAGTAAVMISLIALSAWALFSRAEAIRQGEIAAAGLVTAQARMLNGPETEVVERQALLAIEAIRRLNDRGASTEEAEAVLSTALERLPQRIHTFPPQPEAPVVAFAGDGLRLFRAGGNRIEAWNLRSHSVAQTIEGPAAVTRLDASADGQWLAAVDRAGGVTLHFVGEPLAAGQPAEVLPRALAVSGSLCGAFTRDGSLYATLAPSAGAGYEIVVWRTNTGEVVDRTAVGEVSTDEAEPRRRPRLSFSPPSANMFGSSVAVLATFAGKGGQPAAVARRVFALPGEARPVRRWDRVLGAAFDDSQRVVMTRAVATIGQGVLATVLLKDWKETVRPAASVGSVSPDGRRFTTFRGTVEDPYIRSMSGIAVEIRDTTDGGVQLELASGGQFSTDGNRYLTVSDRLIRIFDLDRREEAIRLRAARAVASVVDSRGGRYLAVQLDDRSMELWDTGHALELVRTGPAQAATLTARGRFATVKTSGETRLLDVANGRMVARLRSSAMSPIWLGSDPVVSPDGTRAVIDVGNSDRQLVDLTRPGRTLWRGASFKTGAVFSPDGKVVVVPVGNELVRGVDAESGAQLWELPSSWVENITFGAAGNDVVIAGVSETVALDTATGRVQQRIKGRTSAARADGTRLATATQDTFTIVGASPDQRPIELAHPKTMSDVAGVAFLPDGRRLATIAGHKEYVEGSFLVPGQLTEVAAFVWDIGSRAILARVPPGSDRAANLAETLQEEDKAYLAQAVLTPDGRSLGGTLFRNRGEYWTVLERNARKDAVVWDLTGTLPRETWRRPQADLAGLSDNGEIAMVLTPHSAQVWSLVRRDLAEAACARVSRDLDAGEWKAYFGDDPYRATCNKTAGR